MLDHDYAVDLRWTGARDVGTVSYRSYGRDNTLSADGKLHDIQASADRTFHGDADRWNPEEMLLGALAQCHLLSYLHVAATAGVVVVAYEDAAVGRMTQTTDGGGRFTSVTLRPASASSPRLWRSPSATSPASWSPTPRSPTPLPAGRPIGAAD
jgi:organic hydroperoxide reductase OsmC/OhrA